MGGKSSTHDINTYNILSESFKERLGDLEELAG
jgi:hypothetical protein